MLNVTKDFPLLQQKINGKQIVYLDSAATAQKPKVVLETLDHYYKTSNANVHRSLNTISGRATELYEGAREKVANFIGAKSKETIFVRNTTEGINLVAYSYLRPILKKGDTILLTQMEHHSNLLPWQSIAKEKGAKLEFIHITKDGKLDMKQAKAMLKKKPKFFAIAHVSNVLGTINPIKELAKLAHENGVKILIDGAQSVPHIPIDVKDIDCDFLAFSGHKMLGPTGTGVIYGKKEILEAMEPFMYGGHMIKEAHFDHAVWNELPWKFEAGTPHIAGAIGLGAAVDYLNGLGMHNVKKHEDELIYYALNKLSKVKDVVIYGPMDERSGVICFNLGDIHAHDLTTVLDDDGIEIRSGHFCVQPLIELLGIPAAARISFSVYSTKEDIDKFIEVLEKARKVFKL